MSETIRLQLAKPDAATRGWTADINRNWDRIDAAVTVGAFTNRAGQFLERGDVVTLDLDNKESVELTDTPNNPDAVGVVLATTIAELDVGMVQLSGPCSYIKATNTGGGSIAIGDEIRTDSVKRYAAKAEWHEYRFGRATSILESGFISGILYPVRGALAASMLCLFDQGLFDVHLFA